MRGVGDSVCAGFAIAVAALFSFLGGDDIAVASAATMGTHEKLFGAKVVDFSLCGGQHGISIISATICAVDKWKLTAW